MVENADVSDAAARTFTVTGVDTVSTRDIETAGAVPFRAIVRFSLHVPLRAVFTVHTLDVPRVDPTTVHAPDPDHLWAPAEPPAINSAAGVRECALRVSATHDTLVPGDSFAIGGAFASVDMPEDDATPVDSDAAPTGIPGTAVQSPNVAITTSSSRRLFTHPNL